MIFSFRGIIKKFMNNLGYNRTNMNILKKSILFSGALTRSLIGIGAAVLLFCTLKKSKGKKKKR